MSAYLTIAKVMNVIDQHYVTARRNFFVPKDPSKRLLFVIDDVHLQSNIKVKVLEFFRSWSIARGYFDVKQSCFKRVEDFGIIMAENSTFVPTTTDQERFMHMTTTLYCEEITVDKFRPFVQSWLTTNLWGFSPLVSKYYILITNALLILCEKMRRTESFSHSSLAKLTSFQNIARFCQNIVYNSMTTSAADVLG